MRLMFCFNARNWTLGCAWDDESVTLCLLCFGIIFDCDRQWRS